MKQLAANDESQSWKLLSSFEGEILQHGKIFNFNNH